MMLDAQASTGTTFGGGSVSGRSWKSLSAWALATVSVLGMLLAFHAVMRGAVEQAQARHQAQAAHAEATRRCKSLHSLRARGSCLSQLNSSSPVEAIVQALNLETGLPVP